MNRSSKSIIKHIKCNLNEQQYIETGHPVHCQAMNIG